MRDLIIGIHSIAEALQNESRSELQLFATDEGLKELKKVVKLGETLKVTCLTSHDLQERAKELCKKLEFNYVRVPNGVFLLADKIEDPDMDLFYSEMRSREIVKVLALDGVTDAHNAAAILRTAAFYGVNYIILPSRSTFGSSPSFYRISSGAAEHVKIVRTSSLPKLLGKLVKIGVPIIGLSEHADSELLEIAIQGPKVLVLGSEDKGLSNAVSRNLSHLFAIEPRGNIKSLNVSVAAAISMERLFS
ncbi:MAG: RNA methyltransferase [Bacteriovoracaceae bacterium]|jgi:23S rRNA (guanosine2251-2'-O)-methyltransferase|nr:RNA methyltransferase [Bacteriovoracaceae bacterium]